jgi:hypothetical protein
MPAVSRFAAAALIALQMASVVRADLYMHHPGGNNDRNRERNENRNNDNLRFDSQNNAKGGYAWQGDRELIGMWDGPQWYAGSDLRIEWTLQHAAGPNADVDAQLVIQASCDSPHGTTVDAIKAKTGDDMAEWYAHIGGNYLRDGYPTGPLEDADNNNAGQYQRASFQSQGQNDDGTQTIPCAASVGAGGCPGPNFNDADMDNTPDKYNAFYMSDASTGGITGATGTWYPTEFAYAESFYWYRDFCLNRFRNKGLYHADQNLNGDSARYTRQDNNGNRYGFECNEERDYYPWWNPSPWFDIAILVDSKDKCDYYQSESQNVKSRFYCKSPDATQDVRMPLNNDVLSDKGATCKSVNGTWVEFPAWGIPAPECILHPYSRDNHLGNVNPLRGNGNSDKASIEDNNLPETASYTWKIPAALAGKKCILRMRYNMSSSDYPQSNWQVKGFTEPKDATQLQTFWDSRYDCNPNIDEITKDSAGVLVDGQKMYCQNIIKGTQTPAGINRPYVSITNDAEKPLLSIAFNTDQISRTFEDRSYIFQVNENTSGKKIINLSMRGRRGNIVQCYPAVELDYVPHDVSVKENEALYIQFCGSDYNPNNNPNNGEGWQYSTRANMVNLPADTTGARRNFPTHMVDDTNGMVFNDATIAKSLAFIGVDWKTMECTNFQSDNGNNANNNITNCGKLNPSKACQRWLLKDGLKQGKWQYVNTRQNNFSNRAMKGSVTVGPKDKGLTMTAKIAIGAGGAVVGAALIAGAMVIYAKKNPNSRLANMFSRKGDYKIGSSTANSARL